MRLTVVLEIDLENFQDRDNVMEFPEDVRDTLLSHFDSIEHLIGESEPTWFSGYIKDDNNGYSVTLSERDFESDD